MQNNKTSNEINLKYHITDVQYSLQDYRQKHSVRMDVLEEKENILYPNIGKENKSVIKEM